MSLWLAYLVFFTCLNLPGVSKICFCFRRCLFCFLNNLDRWADEFYWLRDDVFVWIAEGSSDREEWAGAHERSLSCCSSTSRRSKNNNTFKALIQRIHIEATEMPTLNLARILCLWVVFTRVCLCVWLAFLIRESTPLKIMRRILTFHVWKNTRLSYFLRIENTYNNRDVLNSTY